MVNTRVGPAEPPEFSHIDKEPSLGRPVRKDLRNGQIEWSFKVPLGGKLRTATLNNVNIEKTATLKLTFDTSSGDLSKPARANETAIATIKELQAKFARMDKTEAKAFFNDLKNHAQKIDVISIKENDKKNAPLLGICLIFTNHKTNERFALYHDQNSGQVFKKGFEKQDIGGITAAIKEMYHTGSDIEDRSYWQWLRGVEKPHGSIISRFDKLRHEGKRATIEDKEAIQYQADTKGDRIRALARTYEETATATAAVANSILPGN